MTARAPACNASSVRLLLWLAIGGLLAGCDCVPCPDGFACVLGRCQDTGLAVRADLSSSPPADDLGESGSTDLATPPGADLMSLPPPPDLAPACVPTGGSCYFHKDAVCCSRYCVYSTNKCR